MNGIQRNLTGSKISTSSTKFVLFGPIGKTRWPSWPLIRWDIFNSSSETAKRNSTKLDRKQDLNVLYIVCVFRADREIKMAALASDWLIHFRLHLWNRWTEFNDTWQEARSQYPLPSLCFSCQSQKKDGRPGLWFAETFLTSPLIHWTEFNKTWQEARSQRPLPSSCFSGRSEKQDGRPGLWLVETFSTSPLKPLNKIQRNLTGSKISTSSTKFVFFGPIGKTRWPSWSLTGWDIFDFSSETAEWNSTKLDRKQDLNVLYQVCVFGPIGKTRWPPWPRIGWDIFDFSSETAKRNSTKLDRKQDLNILYQVFFLGRSQKTRWPSWPLIGWDIFDFSSQCPLQSLYFPGRSVNKNVRLSRFLKEVAHCTQVHDMWPFGPLVFNPKSLNFFSFWLFDHFSIRPVKHMFFGFVFW